MRMKIFEGIIVSVGMKNTAVVEVFRKTPHPLYKKLIKKSKKIKADTSSVEPVVGNIVRITETRPISKDKYFKILEIVGSKQIKKLSAGDILSDSEVARKVLNKKPETPTFAKALAGKQKTIKRTVRKTVKKEEK